MLPPPVLEITLTAPRPRRWWRQEDAHLFVLSFGAFFVAITSFIS